MHGTDVQGSEQTIQMSCVCIPKDERRLEVQGSPELLVLFTNMISHTKVRCALREAKGENVWVVRSHSSSMAALKNIMVEHIGLEVSNV